MSESRNHTTFRRGGRPTVEGHRYTREVIKCLLNRPMIAAISGLNMQLCAAVERICSFTPHQLRHSSNDRLITLRWRHRSRARSVGNIVWGTAQLVEVSCGAYRRDATRRSSGLSVKDVLWRSNMIERRCPLLRAAIGFTVVALRVTPHTFFSKACRLCSYWGTIGLGFDWNI